MDERKLVLKGDSERLALCRSELQVLEAQIRLLEPNVLADDKSAISEYESACYRRRQYNEEIAELEASLARSTGHHTYDIISAQVAHDVDFHGVFMTVREGPNTFAVLLAED